MALQYTDFNRQSMGAFNQGQQIGDNYVQGQLNNEKRERTSMLDAQNEQLAAQTASDKAITMGQRADQHKQREEQHGQRTEQHGQDTEIKKHTLNKMELAKHKQNALLAMQMTYEERQPFLAEILKQTTDPVVKKNLQIVMDMPQEQQGEALWAAALQGNKAKMSSEQRAFENNMDAAGLTEDERINAIRIKLRMDPGAVGNATTTMMRNKKDVDLYAKTKGQIKQAEKFAEMTGANRGKAIEAGAKTIQLIDTNVLNLERALVAVEEGAGVGAFEKLFPSIKAASVELEAIHGRLALDVISGVTLGAINEKELEMAFKVALPTGLNSAELKDYLVRKVDAQSKLRSYFSEQIQHLAAGGTTASFLMAQDAKRDKQPALKKTDFSLFKVRVGG